MKEDKYIQLPGLKPFLYKKFYEYMSEAVIEDDNIKKGKALGVKAVIEYIREVTREEDRKDG